MHGKVKRLRQRLSDRDVSRAPIVKEQGEHETESGVFKRARAVEQDQRLNAAAALLHARRFELLVPVIRPAQG
jgi:hypothetical protein